MTVMNLSDFLILNIKGVDYSVYIVDVDKKDAVNSLNNSKLSKKSLL